jgi:DNA-binding NarL/FixJ family response regulator
MEQEGLKVVSLNRYSNGKTAMVLSERELEVLQLVSFGLSSREIAKKLYLSSHTITNHRKNMLARSRCGNLAELVRVALSENLL